ncbi:hypothetical protein [Kitasatospora kifunensis]|uniref:Helix-turn-helix domain-containing protein n=1 Tax=Kitasatospora kifunensis TaxID=58351 RepID=A0A7W7R1R8_KITKI|nr:hypothetical protein [Kitasatospora kifunensis]MBB4923823.1 hypothetical protein [Kitasatospora kifunensis]
MFIHRSAPARHFTVFSNRVLQDRQLSFTARGLLVDLLSRPDGWREDGRQMADSSPQGRSAIRKALNELTQAGYYRVDRVRMPDGTLRSEVHVFDTPQRPDLPGVTPPGSGGPEPGPPDVPYVKNQEKEPTLPGAPAAPDEQTRTAVAALYRAIRPEPRLRIGEAEARSLAPLVARWLERGSTVADLARALCSSLPVPVLAPAPFLRSRLERKLPPASPPPPTPCYAECATCHDPVPRPGICRACAGLGSRPVAVGGGAAATARGADLARRALFDARGRALAGHGQPG